MGRYLRLISFYLLFSIAAYHTATAKERPHQLKPVNGMVHFDLYRGYLMVTRGAVGPLKGLHFLIDTGTSTTLLDRRIARMLNLKGAPEKVNILFFKGGERAMLAHAPSIELGPVKQNHVPVMVVDLSIFGDALPVGIDAVIGLDIMGASPFEVDFQNCRIHFGQLPHLPVSIPLVMEDGLAMVNVQMNHTNALLLLDSGTPSMMIFSARIPKAIAGLKAHRSHNDDKTDGNMESKEVHLPRLKLGQTEFIRLRAIVIDDRDEAGRDFDGILNPAALGIDAFGVDLERGVLELRLGM